MTRPSAILLAAFAVLAGCGEFGRVGQGRVVAYDRQQGIVTLICDSNFSDPANPRYDLLPPARVRIPASPRDMGPDPAPGRLLRIDRLNRRLVVFDPAAEALLHVPYLLIEERQNVSATDRRTTGLPRVDRARRTITLYSPATRILTTLRVADPYLAWPEEAWRAGDEVRYYYKKPGQALRLMNVTRTGLMRGD